VTTALRFSGAFTELSETDRRALFDRRSAEDGRVASTVARIIADVRARGDDALLDMARELDGVSLDNIEVPSAELVRALDTLDPALRRALERSARNIACVHRAFAPVGGEIETEPGIVVGRRPDPLARVGVYAPGGRASYPSSVLMSAIPARVAGVGEVVVCSPPGPNGRPSQTLLAAARLANVDRVFAVGGAGAIAAMAIGTATIARVDRVVGPGNAYVSSAKIQLAGEVGIDSPAGPSELIVIADETSNAAAVAGELIAQAEHDPSACALAAVVGNTMAASVEREIVRQLIDAPRRDIVEMALAAAGGILRFATLDDAVAFTNAYAPEHLLLAVTRAPELLARVRNAGAVFVGETSSVAFGDYMTGANHVLPTAGSARIYSGLSPLDFVRWTSYQRVDRAAAARLADDVSAFAEAEALPSHAATARRWSTT
jgi:histidinol dehydrogenase